MNDLNISIKNIPDDKLKKVALETFFNIMNSWNISSINQANLLGLDCDKKLTDFNQRANIHLSPEILRRISYILGIYKGLAELLPTREQRDLWVQKPNQAFNGYSAVEYMSQGKVSHLRKVREYIYSQANT